MSEPLTEEERVQVYLDLALTGKATIVRENLVVTIDYTGERDER